MVERDSTARMTICKRVHCCGEVAGGKSAAVERSMEGNKTVNCGKTEIY